MARSPSWPHFAYWENNLGFLTYIRSGLVAIIFVAMALILWLTTSFWYVAYIQHSDGKQLTKTIEIQDQLTNLARHLSVERMNTNALLSLPKAALPREIASLENNHTQSDSTLLTVKFMVNESLNNPSKNRLSPAQTIDLTQKNESFNTNTEKLASLRKRVLSQARNDTSEYKLSTQRDVYLQYTLLIGAVHQLQKTMSFSPRSHSSHFDHHQMVWESSWHFNEALSHEIAFHSSVLADSWNMDPNETSELQMLQYNTNVAWSDLNRYTTLPNAISSITTAIVQLEDGFLKEYRRLQAGTKNGMSVNRFTPAVKLDEWHQLEINISKQLTQLGRLNSEEVGYIAENITTTAFRNLVIDTVIIFVCLVFGVAVMDVVKRMRHLSTHDALTGLPNRMQFEASTDQMIRNKQCEKLAVMFVDLDGFKQVNDTLGHMAGDNLLRQVSKRMTDRLNKRGTISRYGGDEFSIVISKYNDKDEIINIGKELVECLNEEFDLNGYAVHSRASIGVSEYPADATTAEDLKRNADFAMYHAKSEGKNRVSCYDEKMATEYQQRISMKSDLEKALDLNQFELYYQPQVSTAASAVAGVEALIRWKHPIRGFVRPDLFIPIAEESGLIHPIGDWVLDEACRQMAEWHSNGLTGLQVAINVSAHQFMRPNFLELVKTTCKKYDLNKSLLELEITESVLATDVQQVINTCEQLRKLGIRVAIDDFGTGYSSLSYLQDLPADTLKIDRSFIVGMSDSASKSVARTIVNLAESCGLETVAEGVETSDQLDIIHELGCDYVQGYYYSKPLPADEIPEQLHNIYGFCAEQNNGAARKAS